MAATGTEIAIFTDGAAKGNPGPGGWGAIIHDGETVTELGGAASTTTNNRMEMEAAIRGLDLIQELNKPVAVYSDSTYLIQGITQWIHGWRRRDWKTAQGGDVLNRDLWERLDSLVRGAGRRVRWVYVPGHSGIAGNERADAIASDFALGNPVDLYRGPASAYPIDLAVNRAPEPSPAAVPHRTTGNRPAQRRGAPYSYLSLVGGVAARHRTWAECEQRVRGVSGARFKKALSADDERAILAAWGAKL